MMFDDYMTDTLPTFDYFFLPYLMMSCFFVHRQIMRWLAIGITFKYVPFEI